MNLNTTELLVILVIVLVLFGAGRVSRVGREMGSAIREFRKGIQGDDDKDKASKEDHSAQ